MKEYKARYRAKNRVALRKSGRKYYRENRKAQLEKCKEYRDRPDVKRRHRKRDAEISVGHRVRNSKHYQKQRIRRQKLKKKKTPGYVYFFKSITPGYYKAGCTTHWERRKRSYSGPSAIARLFFLRPVPDQFYAETLLKIFLENQGYKPAAGRMCDWFVLEEEKVF
jgi:hypothetical protein